MPKFRDHEKKNMNQFKSESISISEPGRQPGMYKTKSRPFCFLDEYASENLYPPIRESAFFFFKKNSIKWHDGHEGNPSNHMCDSQVCCVNFLFPFGDQPEALAKVLKSTFPELDHILPIEDGRYVTFEWIGTKDYLNEKKGARNLTRSRGALCTSADAAVMFKTKENKKHLILIEWKYTEYYSVVNRQISVSGKNRVEIYQSLFDDDKCPLRKDILTDFRDLFYEPFYQFMRQQFLAHEMEKAHELGADIVSVLHIAPDANKDFRKVTSPALRGLGDCATEVWSKLVKTPGRLLSVHTEELFRTIISQPEPTLQDWAEYIRSRYVWCT